MQQTGSGISLSRLTAPLACRAPLALGRTIHILPVIHERGLSHGELTQILPENERLCIEVYCMTSMCTCSTPAPSRAGAMPA